MWHLLKVKRESNFWGNFTESLDQKIVDEINKFEKEKDVSVVWLHPLDIGKEYANIMLQYRNNEGEIYERRK